MVEQLRLVMESTRNGQDLSAEDLGVIDRITNGEHSDADSRTLQFLYEQVREGSYLSPWFCGIPHLTLDHGSFLCWRGVQIHQAAMRNEPLEMLRELAQDLADRCLLLEEFGVTPSWANVSHAPQFISFMMLPDAQPWAKARMDRPIYDIVERVAPNGRRQGVILYWLPVAGERARPLMAGMVSDEVSKTPRVLEPIDEPTDAVGSAIHAKLQSMGFSEPKPARRAPRLPPQAVKDDPRAWLAWCRDFGFTPGGYLATVEQAELHFARKGALRAMPSQARQPEPGAAPLPPAAARDEQASVSVQLPAAQRVA